jgi:hypothetical protein
MKAQDKDIAGSRLRDGSHNTFLINKSFCCCVILPRLGDLNLKFTTHTMPRRPVIPTFVEDEEEVSNSCCTSLLRAVEVGDINRYDFNNTLSHNPETDTPPPP